MRDRHPESEIVAKGRPGERARVPTIITAAQRCYIILLYMYFFHNITTALCRLGRISILARMFDHYTHYYTI